MNTQAHTDFTQTPEFTSCDMCWKQIRTDSREHDECIITDSDQALVCAECQDSGSVGLWCCEDCAVYEREEVAVALNWVSVEDWVFCEGCFHEQFERRQVEAKAELVVAQALESLEASVERAWTAYVICAKIGFSPSF